MKRSLYLLVVFIVFTGTSTFSQAMLVALGVDVHGTTSPNTYSVCDLNNNGIDCQLFVQPGVGNFIYSWVYYPSTGSPMGIGNTAPFVLPTEGTGRYECQVFDGATFLLQYIVSANIIMADNITYPIGSYATISSASGPCGTSTLSALPNFWLGYQWQLNGNPIPGATARTYTATQSGLYRCLLSNNCGFTTSTAIQVNVPVQFPKPVLSGVGGNTNCNGTGIIRIQAPYVAGTHYKWFDGPTNIWLSSAPDTNFLDVSGLNRYIYVVQYNSCKSDTSLQIHVSASTALPVTATVNPTGPLNICPGSSTTLSTPYGVYYFNWFKNGTAISGATSYNYAANATGNYTVVLTDACGNTRTSTAVSVTLRNNPPSIITPQGNTSFCSGGNVVLQANAGTGYTYQWMKYSTSIAGATAQSYAATANGTYKVVVSSQYGCSKTSVGLPVVVYAKPTATITPPGPLTMCAGDSILLNANTGAGLSYQWRKNGTVISNSNSSAYSAKAQGTYVVRVTNSNGCTKISSGCSITINCRSGEFASEDLIVTPNPSADNFNFFIAGDNEAELDVFDMTGKLIQSQWITAGETFVSGTEWPAGIYMIVLQNGGNVITKRIVKTE